MHPTALVLHSTNALKHLYKYLTIRSYTGSIRYYVMQSLEEKLAASCMHFLQLALFYNAFPMSVDLHIYPVSGARSRMSRGSYIELLIAYSSSSYCLVLLT